MRVPITVMSPYSEPVLKLAYSHTEFLAITRSIAGDRYLIVHRPTGLGIVFTKKLRDARAIMQALDGIDWAFGGKWSQSFKQKSASNFAKRARNSRWVIAKEQTREALKPFKGQFATFTL